MAIRDLSMTELAERDDAVADLVRKTILGQTDDAEYDMLHEAIRNAIDCDVFLPWLRKMGYYTEPKGADPMYTKNTDAAQDALRSHLLRAESVVKAIGETADEYTADRLYEEMQEAEARLWYEYTEEIRLHALASQTNDEDIERLMLSYDVPHDLQEEATRELYKLLRNYADSSGY